jgi:hypothetical protein
VRDDEELRLAGVVLDQVGEAQDVRLVEAGYWLTVPGLMTVGPQDADYDAVVGYSHISIASMSETFDHVDWYVHGTLIATDLPDSSSDTQSEFDFTYEGYGGTADAVKFVKARAYYLDGSYDEVGYELTVWSQPVEVLIVFPTEDYDAVSGHDFTMEATTDRPFDYVDWFVHGVPAGRTYASSGSGTHTTFAYEYNGLGAVTGAPKYVKAQAWKDGSYDEGGDWITVWANLVDVVQVEMVEVDPYDYGGTYGYQYTFTTPSNYLMTEATVTSGDGASVTGPEPLGVDLLSCLLTGISPPDDVALAGGMEQYIITGLRWAIVTGGAIIVNDLLDDLQKKKRGRAGTLEGHVTCATDGHPLDNEQQYTSTYIQGYDTVSLKRKWVGTEGDGYYRFYRNLPVAAPLVVRNFDTTHSDHLHAAMPGGPTVQGLALYPDHQAYPMPPDQVVILVGEFRDEGEEDEGEVLKDIDWALSPSSGSGSGQ